MTTLEKYNDELTQVQKQMDSLNEERQTFQRNQSSLNARLSEGIIPDKLFKKLQEAKIEYSKSILENLKHYRVIKQRRKQLNILISDEESLLKNNPDKIDSVKEHLEEIKNKYFDFYRDKTRISGMRKMASDFIIDLEKVIKKL